MSVSYGTITITDTNDIERIYTVYAKSTSNIDAPSASADLWTESISTAPGSGDYIWQRTVVKKSGTGELTYSTPVCVTGPEGDQGKGVKSLITQYYLSIASDSVTGGSWNTTPQSYPTTGTKYYWTKTITTYTDNSTYESTPVYNVALTNSVKDARDANTTANEAKEIVQQISTDVTNLQTRTKHFWRNLTAHTNGTSGWIKPNYPVGTYAASGISGTTFDEEDSSTYGYNTLYSNGIKLRYNAINLGELTGTALTFYNPSTSSQGTRAMELSGSALKFYASNGATVQAEFGGSLAKVSGQLIAQSGYIGTNETNRWFIGNRKNYDQTDSAALVSYGSAYIQLGEDGCWRLSTNRLHTGWNAASGSNVLHYPKWNNIYWDFGIHAPTQNANKFIYIRNYDSTDSGYTEAQVLQDLQDNFESNVSVIDSWQYRFYITADGSLYAKNIYVLDDNGNATQIGGTDGVYLLKSGGTITGNLEVNGTLTKGGKNVAYLTATPTNGQILVADGTTGGIKTSGYTIATSVPQNAVFTDKNVQTTKANTTKIYLTGTQTNGTNTGTLNFDEYVYVDTTAGALHATTFNGYTLAAAAAKGVDTSMTASSTSTNLPTTKAVADLIATYLPLAGGTISGAVDINDELYADSATFGNLIVNGVGRFTNGIYGDLTGNASTATKVNNNLVIKLNSGTTEGTNMFTFNGSAAKTVDVTKSSIGLGSVENKSSATIRGELTSTNVTTALGYTPYDSTNPSGYTTNVGTVTSVRVQATAPLQSSVSTASSTTLNTTISFANQAVNTVLAGPSSGTTNAAPTFRKLVAADIPNITKSKISDFPTSLKNPNALKIKVYNGTSTSSDVTYDGDTANIDAEVAGKGAVTGLSASTKTGTSDVTTFTLTKADGTTSTFDVSIVASEATGATTLRDSIGPISLGSATKPVYFNGGVPAEANTYAGGTAVTLNGASKASSTASFYAPTGAGTNGQILKSNGSGAPGWVNQSTLSVGSATNDSDGNAINATYVKKAGDSITGRLTTTKPINQIITGTGTAGSDGGASASPNRYKPAKWTFNTNLTVTDGDIITIKIPVAGHSYGVYISIDNGLNYYPVVTSNASRLTTHYAASRYITIVFEASGSADSMYAINGSDSSATVTGGVWRVINYYDVNTIGEYAGCCTAGTNGMARYSLIIKTEHAKWESLVTTSTSATGKTKTSNSFLIDSPILYQSANTYTNGQNASQSGCWSTATGIDSRYSFNVSTTWSAAGCELYLVGTISNEKFTLKDTTWWADSLPSTNDGYYYWYVGQMYDGYRFNLHPVHPIYYYNNGIKIYQNASHVNGYTVGINVPSNAVFTDTWKALSTSQAGYVAQAPNDTSKFLRGDATWASVTKSNVGLGSVDNTADANKRVKGANIDTTANAIAYYIDTTGTFGTKASANGALYATAANGTLTWGTLPVGQGGTGVATFTNGAALIGNGTGAIQTRSITNVTSGAVTASTNLITANSLVAHVANAISNASNTYVTLATSQTLTAAATKTYLGLQTYGSNGIAFGTTTNSTVTQKANMKYDATLEAIVFSFS